MCYINQVCVLPIDVLCAYDEHAQFFYLALFALHLSPDPTNTLQLMNALLADAHC